MRFASDSLADALDLAFWPVLTLAAALFALATLAPGLAEWAEVRDRLAAADAEAEALRAEIDGLARVSAALRADPAFAAEVARLDLGLARDGADRLAVPAAPPPVAFVPAGGDGVGPVGVRPARRPASGGGPTTAGDPGGGRGGAGGGGVHVLSAGRGPGRAAGVLAAAGGVAGVRAALSPPVVRVSVPRRR